MDRMPAQGTKGQISALFPLVGCFVYVYGFCFVVVVFCFAWLFCFGLFFGFWGVGQEGCGWAT